jgi:hypothetical protein
MSDDDIILQRDRDTRRWLNQLPGMDGNKYSLSQLRMLEWAKGKVNEYKGAAAKGAVAGAVVGVGFFGVGAGLGALVGAVAGIGVRAYGAPADAVDAAFTRFDADMDSDDDSR